MVPDEMPRYLRWQTWASSAIVFGLLTLVFFSVPFALGGPQFPLPVGPEPQTPGTQTDVPTATDGVTETETLPPVQETETERPIAPTETEIPETETPSEPPETGTQTAGPTTTTRGETATGTGSICSSWMCWLSIASMIGGILSGISSAFTSLASGVTYFIARRADDDPNQKSLSDYVG